MNIKWAELEKELCKIVVIEKPVIHYVDSGKVKNTIAKLSENEYSLNFKLKYFQNFKHISNDKLLY